MLILCTATIQAQSGTPRVSIGDTFIYTQTQQQNIQYPNGTVERTEIPLEDYHIVVNSFDGDDILVDLLPQGSSQSITFDCLGNTFTIPDWGYWKEHHADQYMICEFSRFGPTPLSEFNEEEHSISYSYSRGYAESNSLYSKTLSYDDRGVETSRHDVIVTIYISGDRVGEQQELTFQRILVDEDVQDYDPPTLTRIIPFLPILPVLLLNMVFSLARNHHWFKNNTSSS